MIFLQTAYEVDHERDNAACHAGVGSTVDRRSIRMGGGGYHPGVGQAGADRTEGGSVIGILTPAPFDEYLGARFQVLAPTLVDHIGGHLSGISGQIFGAIIPLSGPTDLPSSSTVAPIALAATTFMPPNPSNDVLVPLSVTLAPGWYALIFGSHEFGATGVGLLANDNTDTAQTGMALGFAITLFASNVCAPDVAVP
jgi:hypothetical protein